METELLALREKLGILMMSLGLLLAGIGFVFLLALVSALSEIPFVRILIILIFSGILLCRLSMLTVKNDRSNS